MRPGEETGQRRLSMGKSTVKETLSICSLSLVTGCPLCTRKYSLLVRAVGFGFTNVGILALLPAS
jgi:hypothetical protein